MPAAKIIAAAIGLSGGVIVSGGLFALIAELGVIAHFADRTHTADKIMLYENCAAAGGIAGTLFSLFPVTLPFGKILLPVSGLFSGIFTGCQAMALAEVLNILPIFVRRLKFTKYIGVIMLSAALGKGAGAFLFFFNRW